MKRFDFFLGPLLVVGALGGCQSGPAAEGTVLPSLLSGTDYHGLAREACGQCHEIESSGLSSNLSAPTFHSIANRRGLTRASLTNWLRNAHNYPDEMNFVLTNDEEGALVNYILSLRDEGYESPVR